MSRRLPTGRTYKELTGVPENLTQVILIEVKHGNYLVGSVPLDTDQISVEGHLRTGRSVEAKRSLVWRIVEAVAQAAAMPKSHAWAHLVDMPATQIVEFGRVVPEPGGEAALDCGVARGGATGDRGHRPRPSGKLVGASAGAGLARSRAH